MGSRFVSRIQKSTKPELPLCGYFCDSLLLDLWQDAGGSGGDFLREPLLAKVVDPFPPQHKNWPPPRPIPH
jgi:hypothetical protein